MLLIAICAFQGTVQYLLFAALSKLFAASLTYPYQVIRARLQDQYSDYSGVIQVLKRTWRFVLLSVCCQEQIIADCMNNVIVLRSHHCMGGDFKILVEVKMSVFGSI